MATALQPDATVLRRIEHDVLQYCIALSCTSGLYAVYFCLVVFTGNRLLHSGRPMAKITFLVILGMLLLDTAMVFIDVNDIVHTIIAIFNTGSHLSPAGLSHAEPRALAIQDILFGFMSNLGDMIVLWRVHPFYGGLYGRRKERWLLLIPGSLLFSSIVASGLMGFCVQASTKYSPSADFIGPPRCKNTQLLSYCTALMTTACATVLIARKTWEHRHEVVLQLRLASTTGSRCTRVMIILVESGALYFLFFLWFVLEDAISAIPRLEYSTSTSSLVFTIWAFTSKHVLGLYPLIIVIVVQSERSYIDETTTTLKLLRSFDVMAASNGEGSGIGE